jgi:hypothetical protein
VGAPSFPADPRVERVIALYDALQRRDLRALQKQVSPFAVLRIGGRSRYAGTYTGLGQMIALAAQFEDRIIPFRSEIDELRLEGGEVRTIVTVSFREPPREVFRARLLETFSFDTEGRITELAVRGEDQPALDRFLGS